jgi:hypothetical protein
LAGSLGGGLSLRTPPRTFESRRGRLSSLSFAFLTEAGYTFASAAHVTGTPRGGTSDVERGSVSLGALSRSAPYVRLMGVARF